MRPRTIGLAALVLLGACQGLGSISAIDGPPGTGTYAENRGTALPGVATSVLNGLAWEDPAEIVYTEFTAAGGGSNIRAVRVADLIGRVIDATDAGAVGYSGVTVSPDGRAVFFLKGREPSLHVVVPGAPTAMLVPQSFFANNNKYSASGGPVVVAPDSRSAAYVVAPDSVRIYDVVSRTSRPLARGCSGLHAFSLNGQQILCRFGVDYFIVNVSNGSLTSFALPRGPDVNGDMKAIRWGAAGIEFIYTGALWATELVAAGSAGTTLLFNNTHLAGLELPRLADITWSRDGRKIAYSTSTCADSGCKNVQFILYVFQSATGQRSQVAVLTLPGTGGNASGIGAMAFSPDGSRIAYVGGGSLSATVYIATVP